MPFTVRTPAFRGVMGGAIQDAHTRRMISRAGREISPDRGSSTADEQEGVKEEEENKKWKEKLEEEEETQKREDERQKREEQEMVRREEEERERQAEAKQVEMALAEERQKREEEERARMDEAAREKEEAERKRRAEIEVEDVHPEAETPPMVESADNEESSMGDSQPQHNAVHLIGKEIEVAAERPDRNVGRAANYVHIKSRLHHMTAACKAKMVSNDRVSLSPSAALRGAESVGGVDGHLTKEEATTPPKKQLQPITSRMMMNGRNGSREPAVRPIRMNMRRPSTEGSSRTPGLTRTIHLSPASTFDVKGTSTSSPRLPPLGIPIQIGGFQGSKRREYKPVLVVSKAQHPLDKSRYGQHCGANRCGVDEEGAKAKTAATRALNGENQVA